MNPLNFLRQRVIYYDYLAQLFWSLHSRLEFSLGLFPNLVVEPTADNSPRSSLMLI
jgi:hypothetical protein